MADMIRPVDFSGLVQRTPEATTMKHNEDNRPLVEQQNLYQKSDKDIRRSQQMVTQKEDSKYHQKKYDAKEKGNGQEYQRHQQKKKDDKKEDRVIKVGHTGGFDIKV